MRPVKLLIVDDEIEFASTLSERLSLRNYDATAVYSAEDALASIQSAPPDVVLLDLMIPRMTGIEVCKHIKKINPAIQIILLTGESNVLTESINNDIFDCILKPVDIAELTKKIDTAARKRFEK